MSQNNIEGWITSPAPNKVYANQGNSPLVDLLDKSCNRILDIGCGAGDNAALIISRHPGSDVLGITHSLAEAEIAKKYLKQCWVFNIEEKLPDDLIEESFDALIFSHVLEHFKDPARILTLFSPLLRSGGRVLIAVPNILSWRMRLQFLKGSFVYESAGVLDDTHLRFFTYFTADRYLFSKCSNLHVTIKAANGSVPLWWLRRYVFSRELSEFIDLWGCRLWPNLFGSQILVKAIKQ